MYIHEQYSKLDIKLPKPNAIARPDASLNTLSCTHVPLCLREGSLPHLVPPDQQLHHHTRLGVPRVVAVQRPYPRVVEHDSDDDPLVAANRDRVPA